MHLDPTRSLAVLDPGDRALHAVLDDLGHDRPRQAVVGCELRTLSVHRRQLGFARCVDERHARQVHAKGRRAGA